MRFTTPILINLLASLNIASAQACDSGTACGYYGTLCCTGDEVCMTDADNQAVCEVPALSSETLVVSADLTTMMPTMVVSSDAGAVTLTEAPTSSSTQFTIAESSESMSGTGVGVASRTSLLSSSTAQSADTSVTSSSASTTGAESTVSTGSADVSDAQASTMTTGSGGRVGRSWFGVVGVGVVVAMVLMV